MCSIDNCKFFTRLLEIYRSDILIFYWSVCWTYQSFNIFRWSLNWTARHSFCSRAGVTYRRNVHILSRWTLSLLIKTVFACTLHMTPWNALAFYIQTPNVNRFVPTLEYANMRNQNGEMAILHDDVGGWRAHKENAPVYGTG